MDPNDLPEEGPEEGAEETTIGPLHVFTMAREDDGPDIHLLALLDPEVLGDRDLPEPCVLGEFTPDADDQFDLDTFERNDSFVLAFIDYMNERLDDLEELHELARDQAGMQLYLVDPRYTEEAEAEAAAAEDDEEPPMPDPADVVGCYKVDDAGRIEPDSFEYNEYHRLFHPERGVSGILTQALHDWLAARTGLI